MAATAQIQVSTSTDSVSDAELTAVSGGLEFPATLPNPGAFTATYRVTIVGELPE